MSDHTHIQWADSTWNPVVGCTRASSGCDNCYAVAMTKRLAGMGQERYQGLVNPGKDHFNGKVRFVPEVLDKPLRRRKPTRYFVNSMSDLFHEAIPDEWIDQVFAVMALSPQHQFQVLTKRAARMREYMAREALAWWEAGDRMACEIELPEFHPGEVYLNARKGKTPIPLPNVWLGVSCEDQQRADERIPLLLDTPAAVRFVSAEPLLERIDFGHAYWLTRRPCAVCRAEDELGQRRGSQSHPINCGWRKDKEGRFGGIDWIIVGGESGKDARPCDAQWIRDIVRQCRGAGVPCFVKQLGAQFSDPENGIAGAALKVPADAAMLVSRQLLDRKGGDINEFPSELRVREMLA